MVYISPRNCPGIGYILNHTSFFETSNLQGHTGRSQTNTDINKILDIIIVE